MNGVHTDKVCVTMGPVSARAESVYVQTSQVESRTPSVPKATPCHPLAPPAQDRVFHSCQGAIRWGGPLLFSANSMGFPQAPAG